MKRAHHYRVSVEALATFDQVDTNTEPLVFNTSNHDDILHIVKMIRSGMAWDDNTCASFAVGLKLFTEVMLQHKDDPLFLELKPAILEFMKKLKGSLKEK